MNKIDFDELWIGDRLWLTTKSIHVKWEGRVGKEKAKVRIFDQIHLVPLSDLEPEREEANSYIPHEAPAKIESERTLPLSFESKTIDLHIEVLKPKLQHERAEIILDYQLRACRQFLTMAIAQKRPNVTIIHGKGEGVLRLEVEHLLKDFAEINFAVPVNNGGASEVWFSYR